MNNDKQGKSNWGIWVGLGIACLIFPFCLECFLYATPVVSRFTNETWFSFIASYTGAIATFIVLRITLKENQRALEKEKERLRKAYEIDKEIDKVKYIQRVLLLDKYDFLDLDTIAIDYARYVREIYDIQYEMLEIKFDTKGETARDKYLTRLRMLERYHTLELCIENLPKGEKEMREYAEELIKKTSNMLNTVNLQRKEIMDSYKSYIDEMQSRKYE